MDATALFWFIAMMVFSLCVGGALGASWLGARNARLGERLDEAGRRHEEDVAAVQQSRAELAQAQAQSAGLRAQLQAEQASTDDKIKTLTAAREALANQFKALSQEILEEKSQRFTEQSQASLKPLLEPLREHIGRFEKQVKEAYDAEGRERSALAQQIRMLEASNKTIAEDALNLSNALRGESKTQGNWGEMILETVLERSGLAKGTQYDTQFATVDADGRRRLPDAVVYLPEERCIVIDSKVSLTAYVRVHEAETEEGRRSALAAHLDSVRRHLKELSAKNYQDLPHMRTLDYVFMFIPSEAAYVEALRGDFSLQREALDKNIALVSPTTLMPMLRAVSNLWRLQQQEENAADIANRAGKLHDKFVGYLEDVEKLGRALGTANKAYDNARRKLVDGSGNIVRRSEQLKQLGAAANKQIGKDWLAAAERQTLVDDAADETQASATSVQDSSSAGSA